MILFELLYLMAEKTFLILYFRMAGPKKEALSHQLQGLPRRSKFLKQLCHWIGLLFNPKNG